MLLNLVTSEEQSLKVENNERKLKRPKLVATTRNHKSDKTSRQKQNKRPKLVATTRNHKSDKTSRQKQNKINNEVENGEKFQVISSLFRKNPEIPIIPASETTVNKPKNDQTFSASEFKDLNLAPYMITNLESTLKTTTMTSVQKVALPPMLDGKDMFIKSPTGTGKTLSYVIPVVQSLQSLQPKIQRKDGPCCIVLVPTRELALQSFTVIQKVLKPFIWIVPGCVTGGEKRKSEKARLRKGVNILVATPGRLVDHLKTTECLKFTNVQWLILDEADRLLDMGFEKDLSFILSSIKDQTKKEIQTILLSATLSKGVERLRDMSLNNPVSVNITDMEKNTGKNLEEFDTPSQLEQFCVVVPMKLRLVTLAAYLKHNYETDCKTIVFFTTQDSVDFHYNLFSKALTTHKGPMKMTKLHGKMSQQERKKVFTDFKNLNVGVLLSTDVAARGLDLPSVNWIIQYNVAVSAADYVHRVGRTARIGSSGKALLFLLPTEVAFLDILKEHNLNLQEMKMDDILGAFSNDKQTSKSGKDYFREAVTSQHLLFEETLSDPRNKDLKQLAQTAFRSFIGAYSTYPGKMKKIFHPKYLHLGHLAKSFAFRETPTELKLENGTRKRVETKKPKKELKRRMVSENDSNLILNGPLTKKIKR